MYSCSIFGAIRDFFIHPFRVIGWINTNYGGKDEGREGGREGRRVGGWIKVSLTFIGRESAIV